MNISNILQSGANVQIVLSLADLKEIFNQWQDERETKQRTKDDVLRTSEEAAKQLSITNVTLWRWAKSGILAPIKVGRKVFYWQSSIDVLLKKEG